MLEIKLASHHKHQPTEAILEKIESHLHNQGGRMTGVRREVVMKMAELGKPKTAYQILDAVNKKRKTPLSAISLYRILEFLMEASVALKIESKNAFKLCMNDAPEHSHLMMVCDKCGHVREIDDYALSKNLAKTAQKHGHTLRHHIIELHGVCQDC